MNKGIISNILRKLGLMHLFDNLRYRKERMKNKASNNAFQKAHPHVKFPPDYLMYESFQMNYKKYYEDGREMAEEIVEHISRHRNLSGARILDWGCGPARVVRHMPDVLPNCEVFGTDYNKKSIAWNKENIDGVQFNANDLEPKLPYDDNFFDGIYGLSILTHLSEEKHRGWYAELHRVTKKGGIILLTTQGNNFLSKMTQTERIQYQNGELVVRGHVLEGHRTYSAFQPVRYMDELFKNAEILEHIVTPPKSGKALPQDVWIVRKM